jgi:hypothetical protein
VRSKVPETTGRSLEDISGDAEASVAP